MVDSVGTECPENWCDWGAHYVQGPVYCRAMERASGPPVQVWRCAECAKPDLWVMR